MDYVSAWYIKAASLIQNTDIKVAFVSTNSIAQGEQVGIIWTVLFNKYKIKIHFDHRTFKWSNEAKNQTTVYCIIIGFANFDTYVCGRLKSDYRYSKDIVYNIFPFLENLSDKQKQKVETLAKTLLDIMAKYSDSSLADLYDPLTMPLDLIKIHKKLDKAVDLCYHSSAFTSELNRIEFLFEQYEQLTNPLLSNEKKKRQTYLD